MKAIADTSRYEASTYDRRHDAACALDAMESEGLIVVRRVDHERLGDMLREFHGHRLDSSIEWIGDWSRRVDELMEAGTVPESSS